MLDRIQAEDIALLVIDGFQMPAVEFSSAGRPKVGDDVLAMGYALDLPGIATLTRGLVSAFRPELFGALTALQTDTAINPGNSGEPLVDLRGHVVGINTAGFREAEGINFAIVIDDAMGVINSLRAGQSLPLGRFVSGTYPFSVAAPEGWRVYEIVPDYVYLRDEGSSAEIYIRVEQLQEGVTTDQFADTQTKLGADGEFDFYEKTSAQKTTLADLPAWEVTETWQLSENDFHHTGAEYFLVSGGLGYSIYAQSERSEWGQVKPAIDDIVASFNRRYYSFNSAANSHTNRHVHAGRAHGHTCS